MLLLTLAGLTSKASAQTGLGITDRGIINLPDTVDMGDTVDFSYWVINRGPLPFAGTLITQALVDGNLLANPIASLSIVILTVGDSLEIPVDNYVFTTQNHDGGGNVMVIWPTGTGGTPQDSAQQQVWVNEEPTAIQPALENAPAAVYPNPTNGLLKFQQLPGAERIEHISVWNINGDIVLQQDPPGLKPEIDLGNMPGGIYFLRMHLPDGRIWTEKIIKR